MLGQDKKVEEKEEVKQEFVSKADFDKKFDSVVKILEGMANKANQEPERRVMTIGKDEKTDAGNVSQAPSNEEVVYNLDPEYEVIFDKYFDREDGFVAMLKGVNFKIEVPRKFSTAQDAHWSLYKHDIRHKVLDGNDIAGSMEGYCKLVAQELSYKRNIKLKI